MPSPIMRTASLATLALALCVTASPAHAALDPGTGSYAFQVTATLVVAAGFALAAWAPRLRALLARRRAAGREDAD